MKSLKKILFVSVLSTALAGSTVFAGVNYIQYHEMFEASRKVATPQRSEGTQLQHQSKYLREQNPAQGTEVPSANPTHPENKYDRRNWNPQQ